MGTVDKASRGASSDYSKIWELPLFHKTKAGLVESFCIDAGGHLVFSDPSQGSATSLIPYATQAFGMTVTLREVFAEHLRKSLHTPLIESERLQSLYTSGLPVSYDLFAPPAKVGVDLDLVGQAIDAYEESNDTLKQEIEESLEEHGVYRFLALRYPTSRYCTTSSLKLADAQPVRSGWVTSQTIVRKAQYK